MPTAGNQSAGRPRSEEAHQAILNATVELLAEQGYSALTVEGVASRAGVGKATIYRRWPSKLPLVVEAFGQLPAFEDVDTGSLEEDLVQMVRRYLERFISTPLARKHALPLENCEPSAEACTRRSSRTAVSKRDPTM